MRVTRVKWDPVEALRAADEGRKKGLEQGARIVKEMANQVVPYELGGLERSADTDYADGIATVFYDTPYALRLHQNPKFHFRNGRRGRWLKTTLPKAKPVVLQALGIVLRRVFHAA